MGGHKVPQRVVETAFELGVLIAQRDWVLLNGGRNVGVMAASARGAKEAGGTVIGILPGSSTRGASKDLDVAVVTGLGDGRNLINVLSSDVVIACPGKLGTLSEVIFALKHRKPVVLLGWDPGAALDRFRRSGRLRKARDPREAVQQAAELLNSPSKRPDT